VLRRRLLRLLPFVCLLAVVLLLLRSTSSFATLLARSHSRRVLPEGEEEPAAASVPPPSLDCAAEVQSWTRDAAALRQKRGVAPAVNLTYFLHVPRTAGRTLFFCALKPAFSVTERCERSYDGLRVDPSAPGCGLLSSHDDHRLVDAFPGPVSVITQLRPPLDRLLSAYEFAVEVAARGAFGARERAVQARGGVAAARTETTNVWPWSVLVPMLTDDIDERAAARNGVAPPRANPYDNGHVMPLRAFVRHPAVAELLHNGAAFQLLGLTNNTREGDEAHAARAARLRTCVLAGGAPASRLQQAAVERLLTGVTVVTLKSRLEDSVALLAAQLGRPLSGRAYKALTDAREQEARRRVAADPAARTAVDEENVDGDPLGLAYAKCERRQRERMAQRRGKALAKLVFEDGTPLEFDRSLVTDEMRADIEAANSLDAAMLVAGTELFEQRKADMQAQGRWEEVAPFQKQLPLK
jgi:hypothetical protein